MLGVEPQLIEEYAKTGQIEYVFWPVINHGEGSFNATLTMECVGQQSPELAWEAHRVLFDNLSALYRPNLDLYLQIAEESGADLNQFRECFANEDAILQVRILDQLRRDRGISGQPIFDINGIGYLAGSQPYDVFVDAIRVAEEQTQ